MPLMDGYEVAKRIRCVCVCVCVCVRVWHVVGSLSPRARAVPLVQLHSMQVSQTMPAHQDTTTCTRAHSNEGVQTCRTRAHTSTHGHTFTTHARPAHSHARPRQHDPHVHTFTTHTRTPHANTCSHVHRQYEARQEWQSLPIVALTAMTLSDDRDRALAVGYVASPLLPPALSSPFLSRFR